ncbi:hypothetical protein L249_8472, partial [Ophiocordyceps polyrhachis-furcata BCC 54312]
ATPSCKKTEKTTKWGGKRRWQEFQEEAEREEIGAWNVVSHVGRIVNTDRSSCFLFCFNFISFFHSCPLLSPKLVKTSKQTPPKMER